MSSESINTVYKLINLLHTDEQLIAKRDFLGLTKKYELREIMDGSMRIERLALYALMPLAPFVVPKKSSRLLTNNGVCISRNDYPSFGFMGSDGKSENGPRLELHLNSMDGLHDARISLACLAQMIADQRLDANYQYITGFTYPRLTHAASRITGMQLADVADICDDVRYERRMRYATIAGRAYDAINGIESPAEPVRVLFQQTSAFVDQWARYRKPATT
jgi:hypothetical protein